jgi:hypothetical protein
MYFGVSGRPSPFYFAIRMSQSGGIGFSIQPEKNALRHIEERLSSFFSLDDIRIMQLFETFQYSILYIFASFIVGTTLDFSFPEYDETKETWKIFVEVIGQCLLLVLGVFYSRKLVKIVPFLFILNNNNKYRPYEIPEYGGEIMISMVLIGTQLNLLKKIDFLSRDLYEFVTGETKKVGVSLGF